LRTALADPECFKGNRMQQVKTHVETLQEKVAARIKAEKAKARETVADLKSRIENMAEFGALNGEQQEAITRPFDEWVAAIEGQRLIAVIRDTVRRFEDSDYPQLIAKLFEPQMHTDEHRLENKKENIGVNPYASVVQNIRSVRVSFEKAWLADEIDVDRYLASMREALLAEIRKGKRIQI
jgi:hypothetical protein